MQKMSNDLVFSTPEAENQEIPAWKPLDEALRKMAVLSQHEKDLSNYQKMKESYE